MSNGVPVGTTEPSRVLGSASVSQLLETMPIPCMSNYVSLTGSFISQGKHRKTAGEMFASCGLTNDILAQQLGLH